MILLDFGKHFPSEAVKIGKFKVLRIKSEFLQGYLNEFCCQFNRIKIPLVAFDILLAVMASYKSKFKHITYTKVNTQDCILCR